MLIDFKFGTTNDPACVKCILFNNQINQVMKRIIVFFAALMSAVMLNAKTVRGYVSDEKGNPIVGMKMVVVNAENPTKMNVTMTDDEGYFSMVVPEDLDTSDLVNLFANNGKKVVQYKETDTGIRIVLEAPAK